jgi:hypothetical protein
LFSGTRLLSLGSFWPPWTWLSPKLVLNWLRNNASARKNSYCTYHDAINFFKNKENLVRLVKELRLVNGSPKMITINGAIQCDISDCTSFQLETDAMDEIRMPA